MTTNRKKLHTKKKTKKMNANIYIHILKKANIF
jgi:hypothetical protein